MKDSIKIFLKSLVFNVFFLGLMVAGVYMAVTAIITGSLLMLFSGIAIGIASNIERKGMLKSIEDKKGTLPTIKNGLVALYDILSISAYTVFDATKNLFAKWFPNKAATTAENTETVKEKEENFAQEIVDELVKKENHKYETQKSFSGKKREESKEKTETKTMKDKSKKDSKTTSSTTKKEEKPKEAEATK